MQSGKFIALGERNTDPPEYDDSALLCRATEYMWELERHIDFLKLKLCSCNEDKQNAIIEDLLLYRRRLKSIRATLELMGAVL